MRFLVTVGAGFKIMRSISAKLDKGFKVEELLKGSGVTK